MCETVAKSAASHTVSAHAAGTALGRQAQEVVAHRLACPHETPSSVIAPSAKPGASGSVHPQAVEFVHGVHVPLAVRALKKQNAGPAAWSQGSAPEHAAQFIHLHYTPEGARAAETKKLAVVGKGLTFDSGGYNLKAGAGSMIELMKFDCGGSAATLGAAKAIGLLRPETVEVHALRSTPFCTRVASNRAP